MGRNEKSQPMRLAFEDGMEAPTRFELVMEVLQTSALPLGDGAARKDAGVKARY